MYKQLNNIANPLNLNIMENRITGLPDGNLIKLWRDGDNDALSVLIKRYKDRIFTTIFLLVKNKHEAEDIFQDVFIRIIGVLAKGEYKDKNKFLPWATRIAHNCCIDHFRRLKRKPIKELSGLEFEDNSNSGEDMMISTQSKNKINLILDMLPKDQREVIILRHYGGLSFKEIADITKCSINTALGRMRYGLINLRKIISEKNIAL